MGTNCVSVSVIVIISAEPGDSKLKLEDIIARLGDDTNCEITILQRSNFFIDLFIIYCRRKFCRV